MVQKKKTSSFRGKVGANAQKTANRGASYGHLNLPKDVPIFSPEPECTVKLDFMPYVITDPKHPDRDIQQGTAMEGDLWYRRPYKLHRDVGADKDHNSAVCLRSVGKKCPICDYRAKRSVAGADKEELKAMNASQRNLYVVIPRGHKKFEEVPHIFDISDYLFQALLTKELKADPDKEVFPDLVEGHTLKIRFEPGTFTTAKPYPEANRIDFVERTEVYDESILDDIPNLDEVLAIMDYKELEAKFQEQEDDTSASEERYEEVDEESTPRPKKTLRKPVLEPEEEEEEDLTPKPRRRIPVEEEEEEVPKPTRKPVRKPVVVISDEEDEDEPSTPKRKPLPKPQGKKVCPHKLRFSVDTEQYDVCDTCNIWSECVAEHEKNG